MNTDDLRKLADRPLCSSGKRPLTQHEADALLSRVRSGWRRGPRVETATYACSDCGWLHATAHADGGSRTGRGAGSGRKNRARR